MGEGDVKEDSSLVPDCKLTRGSQCKGLRSDPQRRGSKEFCAYRLGQPGEIVQKRPKTPRLVKDGKGILSSGSFLGKRGRFRPPPPWASLLQEKDELRAKLGDSSEKPDASPEVA